MDRRVYNQVELERIRKMAKEIEESAYRVLKGYQTPISILGLSNRARYCLSRGEIEYVEQLVQCSERDLFKLRGMGKLTQKEINDKLTALGFTDSFNLA